MTLIRRIVASIVAVGSLLFYTAIPAVAATTIEISGNGADSKNEAQVGIERETTVVQSNEAQIENKVEAEAETGDNKAEKNNGGDVSIETGNATTTVDITNKANLNAVSVKNCGVCYGDVDILIANNGSQSENEVEIEKENEVKIFQDNKAKIENKVEAKAETGDNKAEKNNGGDVSIETGNASVSVDILNAANANIALLGGDDNGGEISARITDNGADSENETNLKFEQSVLIVQDNKTEIENKVEAEAETGDNKAEKNNGGDVSIETGNAKVNSAIDNFANFNFADIDCCIFEISAEIADNGSQSKNEIEAKFEDELEVFQNNCSKDKKSLGISENNFDGRNRDKCEIENKVDAEVETGDNKAEKNNGEDGEFTIATGDALNNVSIGNAINANLFSQGKEVEMPEEFDFFFDLSSLLEFLNLA